jgi:hypothetical protein
MFKLKVDDPIADLRHALAKLQQHHDRLAASRGAAATEVERRTEPRLWLFEDGVNDADANAPTDAAVLAVQSVSASIDDALAEVERQLAQLRLDPERNQVARAAEGISRERDAVQLNQKTAEFVGAAARLVEALSQVTVVSLTASKAAAIAVAAVSEIVDATEVINGELERYSTPIRRQSVTFVKMPAQTPATLFKLPPAPELPSGTNSAVNWLTSAHTSRSQPTLALASAVELAISRSQNR